MGYDGYDELDESNYDRGRIPGYEELFKPKQFYYEGVNEVYLTRYQLYNVKMFRGVVLDSIRRVRKKLIDVKNDVSHYRMLKSDVPTVLSNKLEHYSSSLRCLKESHSLLNKALTTKFKRHYTFGVQKYRCGRRHEQAGDSS